MPSPKPLRFSDPSVPGYARVRRGRGIAIVSPAGRPVKDRRILDRVASLVIPPAWTSVWIAPDATGHIQAIGYDARGRRQYIYHPRYRAEREAEKFRRLADFAAALPAIRRQVAADMGLRGLPRAKVVATVVHLLDRTLIRIGNRSYAEQNGSFGLSTLRNRHVEVGGSAVRFAFPGKSGREWRVRIDDRRVATVIRACQDLPGQHLFQYVDDDRRRRTISSDDVNAYLRAICGREVSAKDFRTWAGTVLCGVALSLAPPADGERHVRRQIASAVRAVAHRLGNTPAVCRSSYIHPVVLGAHAGGDLFRAARRLQHRNGEHDGLTSAERVVLKLLRRAAGASTSKATATRRVNGRPEPSPTSVARA
jgi:DNA topoisomerase-1